jgi:hypothetical protein
MIRPEASLRREEVIAAPLLFAHTPLTRGRVLRGEPAPVCNTAGQLALTVLHMHAEWPHCDWDRRTCLIHGTLRDILEAGRFGASNIVVFLYGIALNKST